MARVLVIDDETAIRSLIVAILEAAGHEVASAEDAIAGLEHLTGHAIDIVVSDVVMPGLSGLDLLREVRLRRPAVPVVLITGAGTQKNLAGADRTLAKPFSHAELTHTVDAALDAAAIGVAA